MIRNRNLLIRVLSFVFYQVISIKVYNHIIQINNILFLIYIYFRFIYFILIINYIILLEF